MRFINGRIKDGYNENDFKKVIDIKTEKWLKASSYLAASALIATLAWQFTHQAVRFSQGDSELTAATVVPAGSEKPAAQKTEVAA